MFKNNPAYTEQATKVLGDKTYRFYIPANPMGEDGFHESRYIAATTQLIYSGAGATKDVIKAICTEMIAQCNEPNAKMAKTNIAVLANNLLYRCQYPVDEHCAIRMGCILSFTEIETPDGITSEDPKKTDSFWVDKKFNMAMDDPDLYGFFFAWGISNTPQYKEALDTLTGSDYFRTRAETLRALTPIKP